MLINAFKVPMKNQKIETFYQEFQFLKFWLTIS